jgi:agmatinase
MDVSVEYSEIDGNSGPPDGREFPRFMGPATFARLPGRAELTSWDVGLLGVPFDIGTSYRPGARFGPLAIRNGSRLLRRHHPFLQVDPFHDQQVADLGDVAVSNFIIADAIRQIEAGADEALEAAPRLVAIGGDHTVALPLLRAVNRRHGSVALVHFDAHLDTWDTYMEAPHTHGTPFRRAREEGLIIDGHSVHVGIRGSLYGPEDLPQDAELGFSVIGAWDIDAIGAIGVADSIRKRVDDHPVYLSVDIDVLDPAYAPATGTPEIGGFTTRELAAVLRQLAGLNVVGADLVEVSPAYDQAEITSIAAANMVYEILGLLALLKRGK